LSLRYAAVANLTPDSLRMDCGRIQCFLIATTTGSVVYERFYLRFTDVEKADIRAAFQRASEFLITGASDESEFADRYK
jgi:hypothetical protein